jgi:hypothetical protein
MSREEAGKLLTERQQWLTDSGEIVVEDDLIVK